MSLPSVPVNLSPVEKFREYLSSRPTPQRFTGQQKELVEYIFSRHDHFDTDQLLAELKEADLGISRATVYRTLSKLVDAGMLRRLEVGTRVFFEHDYGYPAHDHLVCESCGKMIEFQHPSIESIIQDMGERHGFQVAGHSFLIRGTCQECIRTRTAHRRLTLI